MRRHELSDEQYELLEPYLPKPGPVGTKVHLLCDGSGIPLSVLLLAGQAHESTQFEALASSAQIRGRTGRRGWRPGDWVEIKPITHNASATGCIRMGSER